MRVRRITAGGDWTFGQGLANYADKSEAIRQNVVTRIKSFKRDWFLDDSANIAWFDILSSKSNKQTIIREIERVTLATEGVQSITKLDVSGITNREAVVELSFTTIFDDNFTETVGIAI